MQQSEVNSHIDPENQRQKPSLSLMIWLIIAVSAVLVALIVSNAPTLVIIATTVVLCLLIVSVTLAVGDKFDVYPETVQHLFDGLSRVLDKAKPWNR